MEKTAEEILKKYPADESTKESYYYKEEVLKAMTEYATLKSSEDNKALQEVIDFYVESTKDYNALSDMCDKLAQLGRDMGVRLQGEGYNLDDFMYVKILTEYNKLKGGKE